MEKIQGNGLIMSVIAVIDKTINQQVNLILHQENFQRLEATWRGLLMLLLQAATASDVMVKCLNVAYKELAHDVTQVLEHEHSQLYKFIYLNELDTPGGQPFGLIVGDYYFSDRMTRSGLNHVMVLQRLAAIAAAAFVPMVYGASASLFHLDDFTELSPSLDLVRDFQQSTYQAWHRLRQQESSRFIALTLPRLLMRTRYKINTQSSLRTFSEEVKTHNDHLWGNACFAYGLIVIRAFQHNAWFAKTRGVEQRPNGGGVVTSLPRETQQQASLSENSDLATEVYINDRQEKQLSDLGFLVLCDKPRHQKSVFFNSSSLQSTAYTLSNPAAINRKISSQLHYLLCVCRFAHYIKILLRDKIGSFATASECQYYLQQWLLGYCVSSQNISTEMRARYPLTAADVKVQAQAGAPGHYYCTIYLKPHYELEDVGMQLQIVSTV